MRLETVTLCALLAACGSSTAVTPAPPAPVGLLAVGGAGQIALTWTAVSGATSYNILRGDTAGAEVALATSTSASSTDAGLGAGKTYFYAVQAKNSAGTSAKSNEASATTMPAPPAGLTATGGVGQVALTWTAVAGATGYSLRRGTAAGGPYTEIGTPPTTSLTDSTVSGGTTYYYVVAGITAQGATGQSAEAGALTAPDAPLGLSVTTTDTTATVQWTASPGAADYTVLRAPGGTTAFTVVGTTTTPAVSDSGLTPNTSYVYAVHARNASGSSADVTANATTAPTAPTLVTASASNHHVTLSWTAAAGAGPGGYRVRRSTSAGGPFAAVATAAGTSFTDTFLTNGTKYYYVVHTIGGTGESGDSNQANATPFIEVCTVDGSSYAVSVFDGTANGNVPPKRSFGWHTGLAEGRGIGTDGTNVYIASKMTQAINVYTRTAISGDTPPARTISLPGPPTALTVDVAQSEIYVAIGSKLYVYPTSATGTPVASRTLTLPAGNGSEPVSGIQVFRGMFGTTPINQTFVLSNNNILVYNNGAQGTTAPLATIITPSTNSFTRLAGPAYDSTDDAIFVGWYDATNAVAQVGSVNRSGTFVRPPMTYAIGSFNTYFNKATPGGIVLDGNDLWVVLGSPLNSALVKYARTATGSTASATAGFTGPLPRIYQPGSLTLDTTNNELWYVNGKNGASAYLKTATSGNHAPARVLSGDALGVYDPLALGADRARGEIVVLNQSPGHAIAVFSSTAINPTAPARQIVGASTTLDTIGVTTLAVDEAHHEYWVDDRSSNNGLDVFAGSPGGNVAPLRTIIRDVTLGSVSDMFYDANASQIMATTTVSANAWTVSGWNRTHTGNVPADRSATLTAVVLATPAIDLVHDLLFMVTDSSRMSVFARGFPNGTLTAASSFDISAVPATLSAVDGEGSEIYFRAANQILVVPKPASGAAAPARTISGSATTLYNIVGLAICN